MHGYQFHGRETDMLVRKRNNGQLRFGFDLALDLPGQSGSTSDIQNGHHEPLFAVPYQPHPQHRPMQCSYLGVQMLNANYYHESQGHQSGLAIIEQLTSSLYNFHRYFVPQTTECHALASLDCQFLNGPGSSLQKIQAMVRQPIIVSFFLFLTKVHPNLTCFHDHQTKQL